MSRENVVEVLEDVQSGLQHHQKLLKSLRKVYEDFTSQDEFLDVFIDLLKHTFVVFKREPAVDRLINFAGYFVASSGEDFMFKFLQRTLTPFHEARGKAVRSTITSSKGRCQYCRTQKRSYFSQRKCKDCEGQPTCQTRERDCHTLWHAPGFDATRELWVLSKKQKTETAVDSPPRTRGRPKGSSRNQGKYLSRSF